MNKILFLVVLLCWSTTAVALNVQNFRPKASPVSGLHLNTADTLNQGDLATAFYLNWVKNPLESGTPTNRRQGIVDNFVTADFLAAVGITPWLTMQFDLPVNLYHDIAPTFIVNRDQGGPDLGDILLSATVRLLNTDSGWGMAVIPFVTLPSGDEDIFFGDSKATGGATLAGSKKWKKNKIYVNVGARIRDKETVSNLEVNEEMMAGVGYTRPLIQKWHTDLVAEVNGSTTFDKFLDDDVSGPLDVHLAVQHNCPKHENLHTTVGVTRGLTSGYSSPDIRVFAGLSYTFPKSKKKPSQTPKVTEVFFDFDKANIKSEFKSSLDETSQAIKNKKGAIHVVGNTDSMGSESYNMKLSERRANAVKKALVDRGINQKNIEAVGKGELNPIVDNSTPQGRARNRRTEIY